MMEAEANHSKVSKSKCNPVPQPIKIETTYQPFEPEEAIPFNLYPKFEVNACLLCDNASPNTESLIQHVEIHKIFPGKDFELGTVSRCLNCSKSCGTEINGMARFLTHVYNCKQKKKSSRKKKHTDPSDTSKVPRSRKRTKRISSIEISTSPDNSPVPGSRSSKRLAEKRVRNADDLSTASTPMTSQNEMVAAQEISRESQQNILNVARRYKRKQLFGADEKPNMDLPGPADFSSTSSNNLNSLQLIYAEIVSKLEPKKPANADPSIETPAAPKSQTDKPLLLKNKKEKTPVFENVTKANQSMDGPVTSPPSLTDSQCLLPNLHKNDDPSIIDPSSQRTHRNKPTAVKIRRKSSVSESVKKANNHSTDILTAPELATDSPCPVPNSHKNKDPSIIDPSFHRTHRDKPTAVKTERKSFVFESVKTDQSTVIFPASQPPMDSPCDVPNLHKNEDPSNIDLSSQRTDRNKPTAVKIRRKSSVSESVKKANNQSTDILTAPELATDSPCPVPNSHKNKEPSIIDPSFQRTHRNKPTAVKINRKPSVSEPVKKEQSTDIFTAPQPQSDCPTSPSTPGINEELPIVIVNTFSIPKLIDAAAAEAKISSFSTPNSNFIHQNSILPQHNPSDYKKSYSQPTKRPLVDIPCVQANSGGTSWFFSCATSMDTNFERNSPVTLNTTFTTPKQCTKEEEKSLRKLAGPTRWMKQPNPKTGRWNCSKCHQNFGVQKFYMLHICGRLQPPADDPTVTPKSKRLKLSLIPDRRRLWK